MAYASWSVSFGEQPSTAKWNILGTNDASFNDGTGIAADKIEPAHLATGLSSSTWAWQTWAPTLANLSGGTQTTAKYIQTGKKVNFRFVYTLAGAGMGTSPTFTLPVTAVSHSDVSIIGRAILQDTGTRQYFGDVCLTSTTIAGFYRNITDTTDLYTAAISSTAPHTWAATDIITATGCYEAA